MNLAKIRERCILEVNEKLKVKNKDEEFLEKAKGKKDLRKFLKGYCPNLLNLLDYSLTLDILKKSKGLKRLAFMTASKIQMLGAAKALFRHLKGKGKMPKHGILLKHESVVKAENKGKEARNLASSVMKAVRKDYFGK